VNPMLIMVTQFAYTSASLIIGGNIHFIYFKDI
jgi:hypothetical protein